ncbi:PilN domain-containing protein [Arsukibacterium indicum]|uniref:PilN domain-containing protein n=1 Tax=Arsukibacterium indicum TaxID=2848612 RepID=A0ABS6MNY5_9GAMM|nr:PilN domain-containing protein [Arsukibacterium indicum]MBV2130450.1 PilN domain-containing protein [Arsukibacterium indicum]
MKQRINLYQAGLKPLQETFALSSLSALLGLVVTISLLAWAGLQWQQRQQMQINSQAEQQLQQQQQQLELFQQALLQRQPSLLLVAERDKLKRRVEQQIALQNYLAAQQVRSDYAFSVVLQQLTDADIASVWLTHFTLRPGSSELQGLTLAPASVPGWLESLRDFGYFKGQRFNELRLTQQPEQQAVKFHLIAEQGD